MKKKFKKIRPGTFFKLPPQEQHLMHEVMFTGKAIDRLTAILIEHTMANETRRRMFWERVWKRYPQLRGYELEFRIERGAVKVNKKKK